MAAAAFALIGCGARVSLGDYATADVSADAGVPELDAADPFDAEALEASPEADLLDASDEGSFDDGPPADVGVD